MPHDPVTLAEHDARPAERHIQHVRLDKLTTALATVEPRPLPRHDGQSVSPSNPEGWSASVTVQGLRWRLCQLDELTEHPLNKKIYGDQPPSQELIDSIRNMARLIIEPLIVTQTGTDHLRSQPLASSKDYLCGRWHKLKRQCFRLMTMRPDHSPNDAWYTDEAREEEEDDNPLLLEKFLIEANRQRVKTPSQKSREFTELKRIESALAKIRMDAGKKADPTKIFTEGTAGEAAVKAAKVVGMSRPTAEKLEKVVAAADRGDKSAKVVIAEVDAGKKSISAAYKAVVASKPPKNPELVAKIQAHEKATTDLKILLKKNGIDADVSRSKADGKFHVTWHDVTAEQIQKFAETFKSSVITSLENIG